MNRGVAGILVAACLLMTACGGAPASSQGGGGANQAQQANSAQAGQAQPSQAPTTAASQLQPTPSTTSTEADERAYAEAMLDHVAELFATVQSLSELLQDPQPFDLAWTNGVASELAHLELLVDDAEDIEAPDSLWPVHQTYLAAMAHIGKVPDLLAQSMLTFDEERAEEAMRELEAGGKLIDEATKELEKRLGKREGSTQ